MERKTITLDPTWVVITIAGLGLAHYYTHLVILELSLVWILGFCGVVGILAMVLLITTMNTALTRYKETNPALLIAIFEWVPIRFRMFINQGIDLGAAFYLYSLGYTFVPVLIFIGTILVWVFKYRLRAWYKNFFTG